MVIRTSYIISRVQDRMKMQGPLFSKYSLQDGKSRALNQVPGPTELQGLHACEASPDGFSGDAADIVHIVILACPP